jgi:hypothetical protein
MRFLTALLLLVAAPVAADPCPETSSAELVGLILPSTKAQAIEVKPWKKDFCVALVATLESEEKRAFAVALFATGEGPLPKRLKATTGRLGLGPDDSPTSLDLAKYAVSATQTAIGVRIRRHRSYAGGGEASLEMLRLYLPRGRDLHPILATLMSYEAELAGDWLEDGTRDRVGNAGEATIIVGRKATQGYFDMVRKTSAGMQHLRWDAGAYVEIDDDPFGKVVLDIFDDH